VHINPEVTDSDLLRLTPLRVTDVRSHRKNAAFNQNLLIMAVSCGHISRGVVNNQAGRSCSIISRCRDRLEQIDCSQSGKTRKAKSLSGSQFSGTLNLKGC